MNKALRITLAYIIFLIFGALFLGFSRLIVDNYVSQNWVFESTVFVGIIWSMLFSIWLDRVLKQQA